MPPSEPDLPVARVLLDVGLAHLDRPFDYRVRPDQDEAAVPGVRVRVRFAGRLRSGYVLERVVRSTHEGTLAELERVVSSEPVLAPEIAELAGRVAEHYAGTRADVLRLAVPPRHARTEQATPGAGAPAGCERPPPGGWDRYLGGASMLGALADGSRPRAVVSVLPGHDWADLLARAVAATCASGGGSVVVVPDTADVARADEALTSVLGSGRHVVLTSEQGVSARYRRFLAVARGDVRVVVGTRSAVFAPVHDLGLLAVWDDGDDLLGEPRAPYPHARDVALMRAHQQDCAVVLAGHARTAEAARLVRSGWARPVQADRATVRACAPRVDVDADASARLPGRVFTAVRRSLEHGPVLVQVPRRGYLPALSCQRCRARARCPVCAGPLAQPRRGRAPECRWCSRPVEDWRCEECGNHRLRAVVVGEERTAEELGRAFPGVWVRQSGLGHVLTTVPDEPGLVVATPGAEPRPGGGQGGASYAAAVLLDTALALARPDLRAAEESLRRWMAAAAMVRPAADGGVVVVAGEAANRAVQALVRWDPGWFAERELDDREAVRLPPAWRLAELSGPDDAVANLLGLADLPASVDVLAALPHDEPGHVRTLLRVPLADAVPLSTALRAAAGVRSARRASGVVRIRVDPVDLA